MRVTYLWHSGFFVETNQCCLLFDYVQGPLPPVQEKPLAIFVSHSHGDHYSPKIFSYGAQWQECWYVLSDEIAVEAPLSPLQQMHLVQLGGGEEHALPLTTGWVEVESLPSTDLGVAWLVSCGGKTLYHAGDLHLWLWGEDKEEDREMEARFYQAVEPLRGRRVDAAFLPLDPRQEGLQRRGMEEYLKRLEAGAVFPMHCWGQYDVIGALKADPAFTADRERIYDISQEGQSYDLSDGS